MKQVRLGDVCTVVGGSTPKSNIPEYWNGDIKWITPAELASDSYFIYDTERHITDIAVKKTNLNLLPVGTVLLSCRAPIGKTAIVGSEMYCNQGFKNLVCSDNICNKYEASSECVGKPGAMLPHNSTANEHQYLNIGA